MGIKYCFLEFVLLFFFASCQAQNQTNNEECLEYIKGYPLKADNGDSLSLKYYRYQDKEQNTVLLLYNQNNKGFLLGGLIFPFSELVDSVQELNLDNKPPKEFVLEVGVIGSTFGAKKNVIIWFDGTNWKLMKDRFLRAFFKDINKDGKYELINYLNNKENEIYSFKNGEFIKAK